MSFIDFLQLATSTGVLGLGAGIFKWALGVEKRVTILETTQSLTEKGK